MQHNCTCLHVNFEVKQLSANVCRDHIHMNATKWLTLTEFVQYLGKTGQCRVDETPKGWFISLIQVTRRGMPRPVLASCSVGSCTLCQALAVCIESQGLVRALAGRPYGRALGRPPCQAQPVRLCVLFEWARSPVS